MAAFGTALARKPDPVLAGDVIELPARTLEVHAEIDESSAPGLPAPTVRQHCAEPDCILCFPRPQANPLSTWMLCILACFLVIVVIGGIAGAWFILSS